jgi:hypothetical protein
MELEQRIVVGTEMLRERLAGYSLVKPATDRHAIHVSRLDANADDPAREQIYDDHDPVAFEHNRFTSEQIDAPQASFMFPMSVSEEGPSVPEGDRKC